MGFQVPANKKMTGICDELVSVIVPVYNIEPFLPRCLECLKIQTYTNLEIILVDDGSTDGSGRLCDEYAAADPRARVIHQPNTGIWAARNVGQDAARGDYLWFPDGDDYFHKDIVRVMYEAVNQTDEDGNKYDMALVGLDQTNQSNEDVVSEISPRYSRKTMDDLMGNYAHPSITYSVFSMWGKFCRKELFTGVRGENYKYAQDRDVSIKLLLQEPRVIVIQNTLYWWRQRFSSAMKAPDYRFVRYGCETRFLFKHLMSLPSDKHRQFHHFLLDALYRGMANWIKFSSTSEIKSQVKRECRKIVRVTGKSFLKCREIETLNKRIFRYIQIRYNGFYLYCRKAYHKISSILQ